MFQVFPFGCCWRCSLVGCSMLCWKVAATLRAVSMRLFCLCWRRRTSTLHSWTNTGLSSISLFARSSWRGCGEIATIPWQWVWHPETPVRLPQGLQHKDSTTQSSQWFASRSRSWWWCSNKQILLINYMFSSLWLLSGTTYTRSDTTLTPLVDCLTLFHLICNTYLPTRDRSTSKVKFP
jgi:hypothetical protein